MKNLKLAEIALEGYQRNNLKKFRFLDEDGGDTGLILTSQGMYKRNKHQWSFAIVDTTKQGGLGSASLVDILYGKNYDQVERRALKRVAEYLDE